MRQHALRRPLVALLAAALASVPAACDRDSEGPVQVSVIGGEPTLADPRRGPLGPSDSVLVANAAQGLVRFDASGQIVPGLAETWNVSDDGLSYIFRLATTQWSDGRDVTTEQVARLLRRQIASSSRNPLKDALGAVDDVVAMTERVIEIRLSRPRPHLLQLLAQPEMGLVREGLGTGPFAIDGPNSTGGAVRLTREIMGIDGGEQEIEEIDLRGSGAKAAVEAFAEGRAHLVLGGTFADLPIARAAKVAGRALRFDPAAGLFGLVPAREGGLTADPEVRRLLSAAIDREALLAELAVPGLLPRTTSLEPGLDNLPNPAPPAWAEVPIEERAEGLVAAARRLLEGEESPLIRLRLPEGPGAEILLRRLSVDWGRLGITVERAGKGDPADLALVDQVAPSSSPSWYVRRFRCGIAPVCDEAVDELLEGARNTPVVAQRSALIAQAAARIDELQLFLPIAAPIRWSLVSGRIDGFAGNRFAVHTLTGLEQRLDRTGE